MESGFRQKILVLTSACAPFLVPIGAYADTGSLETFLSLPLEDLMDVRVGVASNFVETQLQAGSTVAVVTEEQWKKRGARRLMDAVGHLPSTLVLPNWFGAEQIMIRGYANGNNSGGITTLWDGVPMSSAEASPQFNRQFINLGTLDRIEMIRGPGSVLHGENAFHGVLSMHAFESETDVTHAEGNVASNHYLHAAARHSQGLGKGVRMHLSAAKTKQADQHKPYNYFDPPGTSERANKYDSSTAVAKITSDPNRTLTWNAGLYWDSIDADGFLGGGTSGSSGLDNRDKGGVDSGITVAKGGVGYKIDANTQAQASVYYWTYDRAYTRSTSLTADLLGTGGAHDGAIKLLLKQQNLFGNTQWSAAFDLRHQQMDGARRKITNTVNVVTADADLQFHDFHRDIYSLSLDADTHLRDEKIQLRYGARVDKYSDFGTQTTPRLGLIYHSTPATALKLLYGRGFRAPNALEIKGSATIKGDSNIRAEIIDTVELGYLYKTTNSLTELAVFRSRLKDAISTKPYTGPTDPNYTSAFQYFNSDNSQSKGAEASYTLQKNEWTLETSASYVKSENTTLQQDYHAFPVWILNGGLGYDVPRYATNIFLNGRAYFDVDDGQIAASYPNPAPLKKYLRGDVHIVKHIGKQISLTLDVRNVLNRANMVPSIQASPSPGGIPDEERSVKAAIAFDV